MFDATHRPVSGPCASVAGAGAERAAAAVADRLTDPGTTPTGGSDAMPAGQGGDEQLVPSRRDDADCTEVCCDCPFAAYRFNCRVGSTRYVGAALHGAGGLIV